MDQTDWLRLTFESVTDYAIFTLDVEGRIASWNVGAERVFGYTDEEAIGQPSAIIFTPEDQARGAPEAEIWQAREAGRAMDERWHVTKGGRRFYASGVLTPLREQGRVTGYAKVARDLTERQQAEAALRASEERLRVLLESVQDYAIFTLDQVGWVTSWNEGARRLKGYTAAEIIGKPVQVFYTPADVAAAKPDREMQVALTAGRSEDESWRVRKDGSRFWVNEIMTPLLATDGTWLGFTKISRDLTERRRAEEALQREHDALEVRVQERTAALSAANSALQREVAERTAAERARTTLLHALVTAQEDERRRIARELHDQFGQSVSALRIGLAALPSRVNAGTPLEAAIAQLQRWGEQLDADVDRLALDLRPSALDAFGLTSALQQHVDTWTTYTGVVAEAQFLGLDHERLPSELETTVYRIVQESLTNVLKHAAAQHVGVVIERRPALLLVVIEDDGCGFDPEVVQGFPQAERLGLLGMRERVASVGGTLTIESAPGAGTSLFVRVPLSPTKQKERTDAETPNFSRG